MCGGINQCVWWYHNYQPVCVMAPTSVWWYQLVCYGVVPAGVCVVVPTGVCGGIIRCVFMYNSPSLLLVICPNRCVCVCVGINRCVYVCLCIILVFCLSSTPTGVPVDHRYNSFSGSRQDTSGFHPGPPSSLLP